MTRQRSITFTHDGAELSGHLVLPESSGPHPAVMVMHNARGLGEHVLERAHRLAQLGYAAVATDMYGAGESKLNPQASGRLMMELRETPQRLRARTAAWYEQLKSTHDIDPRRIAAIGFCFGGLCVLELARSGVQINTVVSYHGLLQTSMPARRDAIKGHVAIYTGAKDPYAPTEDVDALRQELSAANARFHITVFNDAAHAFTDPHASAMGRDGIAYDPIADHVSWASTVALLKATL